VSERIETLASELEQAAARLRSGETDPAEAAELVDRCAQLAAELGAELDRESSGAGGQEQLL
jgi:hypothetical protein